MSREFGSWVSEYFHTQIETCADDALAGECEITRKWGSVLKAMEPIAYSIASAEAHDSGEYDPIMASIAHFDNVRIALEDIRQYLQTYKGRCSGGDSAGFTEESGVAMQDHQGAWTCANHFPISDVLEELHRTKRALEMAKDALKHYAIRDNWQEEKYRGTIHGPAIADEALAAIRKELEG